MNMPLFLTYDFVQRALFAGILVAVMAPLLGMFLVVRRYAYVSDTLAHVSLVGVALALLFSFSPAIGALIATLVVAVSIDRLQKNTRVLSDSVLSMFLSGSLALTVVLISWGRLPNANLLSYLFGSVMTVTAEEIALLCIAAAAVTIVLAFGYRQLFVISVDEDLAKAEGIATARWNLVFMLLTAGVVSLSLRVVGGLLIGALMVMPVVAAMQVTRSFRGAMWVAVALSVLSVVVGITLAYMLDVAPGGMIVLVALFCAVCAFVVGAVTRRK